MKAITILLPEPLNSQIESVAHESGLSLNEFFVEVTKDIVKQEEARKRFMARAEAGQDKIEAALAMLQRD